jgi:hypothetical protein
MVALESHWLLGKSLVAMEVTGCYGKLKVDKASLWVLRKYIVAVESQ